MSVRLGVLVIAVSGCASVPVKDDSAARIEADMAAEKTALPEGLPMGEAPALAKPDPASMVPHAYVPRDRLHRHLTAFESDYYTGNVSVPSVTTGNVGLNTDAGTSRVPTLVP